MPTVISLASAAAGDASEWKFSRWCWWVKIRLTSIEIWSILIEIWSKFDRTLSPTRPPSIAIRIRPNFSQQHCSRWHPKFGRIPIIIRLEFGRDPTDADPLEFTDLLSYSSTADDDTTMSDNDGNDQQQGTSRMGVHTATNVTFYLFLYIYIIMINSNREKREKE